MQYKTCQHGGARGLKEIKALAKNPKLSIWDKGSKNEKRNKNRV